MYIQMNIWMYVVLFIFVQVDGLQSRDREVGGGRGNSSASWQADLWSCLLWNRPGGFVPSFWSGSVTGGWHRQKADGDADVENVYEGRAPAILLAVIAMHCRVFRLEAAHLQSGLYIIQWWPGRRHDGRWWSNQFSEEVNECLSLLGRQCGLIQSWPVFFWKRDQPDVVRVTLYKEWKRSLELEVHLV